MSLSRDDILEAVDAVVEKVNVPQWGGDVCIRSMTAEEYAGYADWRLAESQKAPNDPTRFANVRERLAVFCVCDESGAPLFTEADIPALSQKSGVALETIARAAIVLNKLTPDAVEDEVKNLSASPIDGSAAGSPGSSGSEVGASSSTGSDPTT